MKENDNIGTSSAEKLNDEILQFISGASDQEILELERALLANPSFADWDSLQELDDYDGLRLDRGLVADILTNNFCDHVDYLELNSGNTPNKYVHPWHDEPFSHQEMLRIIKEYKG
jgi:hypothetical protein